MRHLARHQQVNFSPMVLVVGQTLVCLGLRERREAVRGRAIDGLAVVQQADDVVDSDPRALHARIAASDVRRAHDVSVGFGDRASQVRYVRGPGDGDQ